MVVVGIVDYLVMVITAVGLMVMVEVVIVVEAEACFMFIRFVEVFHFLYEQKQEYCLMDRLLQLLAHFQDQ